jgi:pilus assembly protein Flp/PilA
MQNLFSRCAKNESGVTAIEYGLVAALISLVCIDAMTTVRNTLLGVCNTIGGAIAGAV